MICASQLHIGRETFFGVEHKDTPPKSSDIYYWAASRTPGDNSILAFAAQVQYFIQHQVTVRHTIGSTITVRQEVHTFAFVLHYVHDNGQSLYSPTSMFKYKQDPHIGRESFIPIRRIAARCTKIPDYNYTKWKKANIESMHVHEFPDTTSFYICPLPRKM